MAVLLVFVLFFDAAGGRVALMPLLPRFVCGALAGAVGARASFAALLA